MDKPLHPFRAYRRRAKMKLYEAAKLLGTSEPKLCRIELGRQEPDLDFIRRAIAISGGEVTAADFVRFQPERAA